MHANVFNSVHFIALLKYFQKNWIIIYQNESYKIAVRLAIKLSPEFLKKNAMLLITCFSKRKF